MKKVLSLLIPAVVLLSCDKTVRFASYQEEFVFPLTDLTDTVGTTVSFDIQYFDSFKGDKSLTDKMNEAIKDSVLFGQYSSFNNPAALPQSFRDVSLEDGAKLYALAFHMNEILFEGWEGAYSYKKHFRDHEWGDYPPSPWIISVNGWFDDQYTSFQTYNIETSVYSGGAHSYSCFTPIVFDLKTGSVIGWEDIVSDYNAVIELSKTKAIAEDEFVYGGDSLPQYFTFSNEGIVFYAQDYAPSVLGFLLKWDDLKPLLAKDFSSRLGLN
jgi:hypothetical protein